jgi:hypothetical protein
LESRSWLDPLFQAFVAREAEEQNRLRTDFAAISPWPSVLEHLAEAAAGVERLGGEPLNELGDHRTPSGVALLWTLEDSLTLADLENGPRPATSREVLDLLQAARREGVWPDSADEDGSRHDRGQRHTQERVGEPEGALTASLVTALVQCWTRTVELYLRLAPEGHEMTQPQRTQVQSQLHITAACLRKTTHAVGPSLLVREHSVRQANYDLRPTVVALRLIDHNLILACSPEPSRRNAAMPVKRVIAFANPVIQYWLERSK